MDNLAEKFCQSLLSGYRIIVALGRQPVNKSRTDSKHLANKSFFSQ